MEDIQKTMAWSGLLCFGGVGMLIFGLGVSEVLEQRELLARATPAEGRVLRLETRTTTTGSGSNRQTSTSDCAVIEFQDADGVTRESTYCYGLLEASFEKGDTARLLYDPQDPDTVLVDGFAALWLGNLAILGMGGLFMGAGAFSYWMMAG